jgi:hypothetical protein
MGPASFFNVLEPHKQHLTPSHPTWMRRVTPEAIMS